MSITELPPVLVDHILQSNSFDTTIKPAELLQNDDLLNELVKLLSEARKTVEEITSASVCTGYIFAKSRDPKHSDALTGDAESSVIPQREDLLYDDFHPFIPHKLRDDPSVKVLEFKGYNQTVDEFFSSLEGQKLETRLTERETAAKRKLEAAKADQEKRIEGLQEAQTLNMRKAAAIEANVERVQEAMDAVNGLLAQGMDWVDIGKLVEREKKRQNPVADIIILPLNLAENLMTLELAEEDVDDEGEADPFETDSDSDDEGETPAVSASNAGNADKSLKIEINLTQSPWSNAREYYDQRKTAAVKKEKTEQQAVRALKSAEQKINEDLKKGLKQEKALLQPIRKQFWFEKFIWFVSSDGYLVLGGKDAQQNEMLYKRHLRKGDVYCHAELRGATSVFIKNNPKTPDAPIPPATLAQAGNLSVCASEAWDQKAGMGAWWVNAVQVSKSAPTGDFLPPGIFNITGNKNFLPPAQLLLGLGIMFRISEESKARHVKHRVQDDIVKAEESSEAAENPDHDNSTVSADDEQSDYASDDDNDEGERDSSTRANPLQGLGDIKEAGSDDNVDEIGEDMSNLQVEDSPALLEEDGGQEDNEGGDEPTGADDAATTTTDTSSKPTPSQSGTSSPMPGKKDQPKRGQKGKAKKIAARYKNQDEEDRAAAEALIGATAGKKRAEEAAQTKAVKQAEHEAAKERRRAQHMRQQKDIAEHEEKRKAMMDERGVGVLGPDEEEQTTSLDVLVGTPLPGDEIIEAVPFCAPWNALTRVKYKAKMQPGPVKKGKAVKEVLERWKADSGKKGAVDESARDAERMWPREVELIKAIKSEEVVNCVPAGKVRVMMGGGSGGGAGNKGKGKGGGSGSKGGKKK